MQKSNVRLVSLRTANLEKLRALDIEMLESFLPDVRKAIVGEPSNDAINRPLQIMRRGWNVRRRLLARLWNRSRMRVGEGEHVRSGRRVLLRLSSRQDDYLLSSIRGSRRGVGKVISTLLGSQLLHWLRLLVIRVVLIVVGLDVLKPSAIVKRIERVLRSDRVLRVGIVVLLLVLRTTGGI